VRAVPGIVRRMSPETFRVLCGVFALWSLALTLKSMAAIRAGKPYTFSMWDGGALRAGKSLTPFGTKLKAVNGLLITIGCILTATMIFTLTLMYVFIGIMVGSIVCDLIFTAS
jgi:hypothetical protein